MTNSHQSALQQAQLAETRSAALDEKLAAAETNRVEREATFIAATEERTKELQSVLAKKQAENASLRQAHSDVEQQLQKVKGQLSSEANSHAHALQRAQDAEGISAASDEKLAASQKHHAEREAILNEQQEQRLTELQDVMAKEQAECAHVLSACANLEQRLESAEFQLSGEASTLDIALKRASDELKDEMVAAEKTYKDREETLVAQSAAIVANHKDHLAELQELLTKEQRKQVDVLHVQADLENRLQTSEAQLDIMASSHERALKQAQDSDEKLLAANKNHHEWETAVAEQHEERLRDLQQTWAKEREDHAAMQHARTDLERRLQNAEHQLKIAGSGQDDAVRRAQKLDMQLTAANEQEAEMVAKHREDFRELYEQRQARTKLEQQLQDAQAQLSRESSSHETSLKKAHTFEARSSELDEELAAAGKRQQALETALIAQQEAFRDLQALLAKEQEDHGLAQQARTGLEQRLQNAEAEMYVMAQNLETANAAGEGPSFLSWIGGQLLCARQSPSSTGAGQSSFQTPAKASRDDDFTTVQDVTPRSLERGKGGETGST